MSWPGKTTPPTPATSSRSPRRRGRVTRPGEGAPARTRRAGMGAVSVSGANARRVDRRTREALYSAAHRIAGAVVLVLLSPLMLAIACAIKLTSRGPIFYRGQRVGEGERIFTIYKFRTLVEGAEQKIGARLLTAADRDSLATPIGPFLKKSKLDELPQLLNVVKGEMRLVGPRPIRPIFLPQLRRELPRYGERFQVPPGITGIAQVRGGYYTIPRNKLRYDLKYIQNRSLLFDLQIVLFTVIKILDRWLPAGVLVLFLFLFVSFVPAEVRGALQVSFFGWKIGLVYVVILLAIAQALAKKDLRHFSLYRSPINAAIVAFLAFALIAAPFSPDPWRYVQGTGYYVVTGFLVAFMIVNTLGTERVTTVILRGIALTSVVMSLLGLGQLFLLNGEVALASSRPEDLVEGYIRIASLLGNPMILAVYLVLGIPLLFCEVTRARTQSQRDFWLVCSTISVVGIVFTQTRVGLVALAVTATFFLSRRKKHALAALAIFAAGVALLAVSGASRFSPSQIAVEVEQWIDRQAPVLESVAPREWLVGRGPTHPFWVDGRDHPDAEGDHGEVPNMHVTLMRENGVGGWIVTMWLVLTVVWMMKRAHDQVSDERLKIQLWAIMSCVVGFLVSMNGMNSFHNLPVQIFFWSLIGIGLEIVNNVTKGRRMNLIWRFGDAGD